MLPLRHKIGREQRHKRIRKPKIALKHRYRVKARDPKDRPLFFQTRTKDSVRTIKRFVTLKGLKIDRITQ